METKTKMKMKTKTKTKIKIKLRTKTKNVFFICEFSTWSNGAIAGQLSLD